MYSICRFSGNQMNVRNGRNLNFETFSEFADHFSTPAKGGKHERYFVRGALDPIYRVDANLAKTNIFVIDGDGTKGAPESGAPDPRLLHSILTEHKINHFIYTTHSHSAEKNKFRCVLEISEHSKPELKQIAANVVGFLHINDFPLLYVKEMNTWSQPWFYPTRDDPDDGLFYFAKYTDGGIFRRDRQMTVEEVKEVKEIAEEGNWNLNDMYAKIRNSETYHEPLMLLSFQMISDGIKRTACIANLQAVMMSAKTQDARWKERYDAIPGLVDGAISRKDKTSIEEEDEVYVPTDLEHVPISEAMTQIVRPPALLGKLFDTSLAFQHLPSEVFAFASTIGLLAGICGRKFNVSGTGLNVELLVIARTGRGKDSIRKFITQTLYALNENGSSSSFLAPARFTGPVAMYNALKDSRSCVSVQTECGLIKSSDAGDGAGCTRYQLGLYSASGRNEVMGGEGYSSKDGSIQALNSAAMSFVMESTAESFMTIFSSEKAMTSGELPRVGIYRETDFIPDTNFHFTKPVIPDDVFEKLSILANVCAREQAKPTPDVIDMEIEDKSLIEDINTRWRQVMNEEHDTKMLMATRNTLRTLKYAAIAAVFNNEVGDNIIHNRELMWANNIVEAEYASIDRFFRQEYIEGDIHDVAKRAKISINKALAMAGVDKSKRAVPPSFARQGCMPVSIFKEIVLNIKAVKQLGDKRGGSRDGAQKLLEYLIANRYCSKPHPVTSTDSCRKVTCIKFLKEFETL